jgi:putative sigma-54 modulation protein
MTILFTGRKTHLTPSVKEFAEAKLKRLERVLDPIRDAHVILDQERHRHVAEIVVKARHATFTAKGAAAEPLDAIGACVDRLVVQARRHRERARKERKRRGAKASPRRLAALLAEAAGAPGPAARNGPGVIRMGRMPAKPMSVEEALLEARDTRSPVLVFRNAESQQVAVLFLRPDGRFGLIEAEA